MNATDRQRLKILGILVALLGLTYWVGRQIYDVPVATGPIAGPGSIVPGSETALADLDLSVEWKDTGADAWPSELPRPQSFRIRARARTRSARTGGCSAICASAAAVSARIPASGASPTAHSVPLQRILDRRRFGTTPGVAVRRGRFVRGYRTGGSHGPVPDRRHYRGVR